jgi:hypothetical protein
VDGVSVGENRILATAELPRRTAHDFLKGFGEDGARPWRGVQARSPLSVWLLRHSTPLYKHGYQIARRCCRNHCTEPGIFLASKMSTSMVRAMERTGDFWRKFQRESRATLLCNNRLPQDAVHVTLTISLCGVCWRNSRLPSSVRHHWSASAAIFTCRKLTALDGKPSPVREMAFRDSIDSRWPSSTR